MSNLDDVDFLSGTNIVVVNSQDPNRQKQIDTVFRDLTLLKKSINKSIGDSDYTKKLKNKTKKDYTDSEFPLNEELSNISQSKWSMSQADERRKKIIEKLFEKYDIEIPEE